MQQMYLRMCCTLIAPSIRTLYQKTLYTRVCVHVFYNKDDNDFKLIFLRKRENFQNLKSKISENKKKINKNTMLKLMMELKQINVFYVTAH